MNKLFTLFMALAFTQAFGQIGGVGISPGNNGIPDPSAALDIQYTNKGFLMPRLSQAQRDSIVNPAYGLMILDTTSNCFQIFMASTWQSVFCACSGPPVPGAISGTDSACPNASGMVYTINSVSGAKSYTWSLPPGASISANVDTAITVTYGSNPGGNISVLVSNSCGTGSSSLPIIEETVCSPFTYNASSTGDSGTIYTFTAPFSTTYTITAAGAQGGASTSPGGYGAIMSGQFNINAGQQLQILVGQAGVTPPQQGGGGGGGGTFVVLNGTPLIVAGGGGGGGGSGGSSNSPPSYAGGNASTSTNAGASTGGNSSGGGTANAAGVANSGNYSGGSGGGGTCCNGQASSNTGGGLGAGGGAGLTGNGGVGQNANPAYIAYSFVNGGYGGFHTGDGFGSPATTYGGFGGGGNGDDNVYQAGGGGGGGYTGGGGGCGLGVGGGGGGGGSYNSGANQSNAVGQTGNGYVTITW